MLRNISYFKIRGNVLWSRCLVSVPKVEARKYSSKRNKLMDCLRTKIEATGPITVADYMKEALVSPFSGYYMSRDVFGTRGDFITSPEVSQIFGELIGIWFFNEWSKVGQPQPLQLIELGPGRGTLTDDILRVFSKLSLNINLSVHFVEVSPHLCQLQMSKLCSEVAKTDDIYEKAFATKYGFPLSWHPHLKNVPEEFSLFLAHEFFDAMPIHKFQRTQDGWREILIDFQENELQFIISRSPTPATKLLLHEDEKRDHVEISPESLVLLDDITKRMREDGGISLIVDYGHCGTKTDTFRSFKEHKLCDPLKNPGESDLTADVDFEYFTKHSSGKAVVFGPINQANFLKNMGIDIRLQKLLQSATLENQKSLKSGYEMLTGLDQMGERYKFLALFPVVLKDYLCKYPPAGF